MLRDGLLGALSGQAPVMKAASQLLRYAKWKKSVIVPSNDELTLFGLLPIVVCHPLVTNLWDECRGGLSYSGK